MAVQELKLKDVHPGENYRKHMDKAGMKELTASVKSHGVLQPIIVRKVKKGYEIIAGYRRHAAALAAGLKSIPASVVTADDAAALEIAVIENSQREDPNPMDEALGFKRLLELGKHDVESLAARLDTSRSYVYARLRLLELDKSCQKELLSGSIDLGHATALLRIPDKKEQKSMLDAILEQDMSPAQVRESILSDYGVNLIRASFDTASCAACDKRSSVQAKLFADTACDDDQCLDTKCFAAKGLAAAEETGRKFQAQGWPVVAGEEEVRKLRRKGTGLFGETMKKKCKDCHERTFFYYSSGLSIFTGWQCPSQKCYDETVLGVKPQPKEKKAPAAARQVPEPEPTDITTKTETYEGEAQDIAEEKAYQAKLDDMYSDGEFMSWLSGYKPEYGDEFDGDLLDMHEAWKAGRNTIVGTVEGATA